MRTDMIDQFIQDRLHTYPTARMTLASFIAIFQSTLTPRQRRGWPRSRIVAELQQRFPMGKAADRRTVIGGLSSDPPMTWRNDGGRLRLVSCA